MGNRIHPFIARRAMNTGEPMQPLAFTEDLFDDDIERLLIAALRLADQAAQTLKILRGIAQAIDMVEPQALQLSFRNQALHQPVCGFEDAGLLDAQACQRINVEEAAIIDVAGSEPPVAEPVMLALEQMVQRQRPGRAVGAGAIGIESPRNDLGTPVDFA